MNLVDHRMINVKLLKHLEVAHPYVNVQPIYVIHLQKILISHFRF
jgi:hypothetical protein